MRDSTPEQLRFPPLAGYTVRADFKGGALSSDFGALLLRGIDRQIGLTERLAAAVQDKRHPSYIDHALRDLFRGENTNSTRVCRRQCVRIASGTTPCLSSAWSGPPGASARLGKCPDLLPARAQCGPQRSLPAHAGVRRPLYRQLPRPPPRCSTLITPMTRPMASRNSRSITITTGAIAISHCLFSKAPPRRW